MDMVFSFITAPLTGNHFCDLTCSHTHKAHFIKSKKGSWQYEFLHCGAPSSVLPWCFQFYWWKDCICLCHKGIQLQHFLFPCPSYLTPLLSLREMSLYFSFYPQAIYQHIQRLWKVMCLQCHIIFKWQLSVTRSQVWLLVYYCMWPSKCDHTWASNLCHDVWWLLQYFFHD